MGIVVMKFGGTSVADADKIRAAAARAVAAVKDGRQVVMVVSARGKKTDELVGLAAEITEDPSAREMDVLLSTGEQESVALMAMAIQKMGVPAVSMTGGQIGVVTDSAHTKARIQSIGTDRMRMALDAGNVVVACGFQGIDPDRNITTLGRGGSDTTATALAAALLAEECQIYTDVEGVFTTDPRVVSDARKIGRLSYDEMLELASLGAGVMHSRSIEFAKKYRVPLRVAPSYAEGDGSVIAARPDEAAPVVTGVACVKNEVRVSVAEIPDRPGALATLFEKMAARKIAIDMVVQDVSTDGTAEVTFTVPETELAATLTAATDAIGTLGSGRVETGTNVAKVSVVGAGMRTHSGVAAQMFDSLAAANGGVNIQMVTTSEIKISTLIDRDQAASAISAIHNGFHLDKADPVAPPIGAAQDDIPDDFASREDREQQVVTRLANMEDIVVSEVGLDSTQARITIDNVPDQPGMLSEVFTAVAEGGVMVDLIVQNISHSGLARLSFTVPRDDVDRALLLVRAVMECRPETEILHDRAIAILSVCGIGLRSHTGVGEAMFRALGDANINIAMVATSEIRMSVVLADDSGTRARDCLQTAFELA